MKRYSIHAYESRFGEPVARLLAEARRERRRLFPMLPSGLDDPSTAGRILERARPGVVALAEDGSLCGFLFAELRDDLIWGPSLVSDPDGWALAPGIDARVLARLYGTVFGRVSEHRVHVSAWDRTALDAWFHLGFGLEQAYAVARLDDLEAEAPPVADVTIRRAKPGDEDILGGLSPLIATMQAGAPVWAGAPAQYLTEIREGFRGLATDAEAIVLLALRGERAVGYQAWFPMEAHPIDGPFTNAVELSVGATVPGERGTGVGRLLTAHGVSEARKAGFAWCFTDWRTTNPLSSSFWPARGFQPFLYRLTRRLSPLALAER